jgi:hypothetical protein
MNLQLQILASLRLVHPRMLPEDALWAEIRMSVVPQPTKADFKQALRIMEDKSQVIVTKDDDRTRVKITADGIARHEEAHS